MSNRWYRGCRPVDGPARVEYWDGLAWRPLPPRLDLWSHSPDGMEWGYLGSGPAQTALAILADALGLGNLALACHQCFKADIVSHFTRESWQISRGQVIRWVLLWIEREHYAPEAYSLTGRTPDA